MKRIPEFTVAVLVCISVVVYWSQHRRIRQLESENRVLVLERDLADADRQAQVPPAHPPTPDRGEQERVAEVLRLRAEVNRLEALVRGTSAKTASGPGAASAPPSAPEEVLQDLGNATPDAAATTLLWALMQADEERFRALIHDSVEWPPQVAGQLHRRMFELQRQNYGNRTFTGVRGIRPKEDGSVRVDFGFLDPDSGKETTTLLHLRQGSSGWGLDPGPPPRSGFRRPWSLRNPEGSPSFCCGWRRWPRVPHRTPFPHSARFQIAWAALPAGKSPPLGTNAGEASRPRDGGVGWRCQALVQEGS